ncbi:hypothetical protein CX648_15620 [Aeromonas dhakensis]|nr:hypothetical protein CX648_15620 [Aeromonas dhakensis]
MPHHSPRDGDDAAGFGPKIDFHLGILLNNLEMKRLRVQTGGISVMRLPSSKDAGNQVKGEMTGDSVRCGT